MKKDIVEDLVGIILAVVVQLLFMFTFDTDIAENFIIFMVVLICWRIGCINYDIKEIYNIIMSLDGVVKIVKNNDNVTEATITIGDDKDGE